MIDRLFHKIESKQDIINENEEMDLEGAEIVIIAYGSVSLAVKEALKDYNKESKQKVGFFRPKTLWPSPAKRLKEIGDKYEKILVIELNKGQYLEEIERAMQRKVHFFGQANGRTISPKQIIAKLKEL